MLIRKELQRMGMGFVDDYLEVEPRKSSIILAVILR